MITQWKKDILFVINNPQKHGNTIRFEKNGKLHNIDFPAYIQYYPDGNIKYQEYYSKGKSHRNPGAGPAHIKYYLDGNIEYQIYYFEGKLHRNPDEGPASIRYYPNGNIEYQEYWVNGIKQ